MQMDCDALLFLSFSLCAGGQRSIIWTLHTTSNGCNGCRRESSCLSCMLCCRHTKTQAGLRPDGSPAFPVEQIVDVPTALAMPSVNGGALPASHAKGTTSDPHLKPATVCKCQATVAHGLAASMVAGKLSTGTHSEHASVLRSSSGCGHCRKPQHRAGEPRTVPGAQCGAVDGPMHRVCACGEFSSAGPQ